MLRRLDERKAVGVESRNCEPLQPRPLRPPVVFTPCVFLTAQEHLLTVRSSKRAMKFSVTGVCTSFAALAMVHTHLFASYRLSGTLDRLCQLDIRLYGAALQLESLWDRWFRRQRPHAHASEVAPARSSMGTLSESLVSSPSPSHWCHHRHGIVRHSKFGRLCCATSIFYSSSSVARFERVRPSRYRDLGGSPSCLVTLMASDFCRVIYLT